MKRKNPAIQPENSDFNIVVEILKLSTKTDLNIYLADKDWSIDRAVSKYSQYIPYGYIKLFNDNLDPDIYFVRSSKAPSGYGPLLYDIALELVTASHKCIMPDHVISIAAANVWKFYLGNRPDVIKRIPEPIPSKSKRESALKKLRKEGFRCSENPLLFCYSKPEDTILRKLNELGRIKFLDNHAKLH